MKIFCTITGLFWMFLGIFTYASTKDFNRGIFWIACALTLAVLANAWSQK